MPHGLVALHTRRVPSEKRFLVLCVKFLLQPLQRLGMTLETVVVWIRVAHLDRQMIGVCVVFLHIDQTFHFGRRGTEQSVGCVAIVALVTGYVAIFVVDCGQTFTLRVRHVIDVWLHRFVARGAELDSFGSLEDENSAERNGDDRKNSYSGYQQPQGDRTGNLPAIPHKAVDDDAGAKNEEHGKNLRSVVLDWIVLERDGGAFPISARGDTQKAQQQTEIIP